MVYSHVPGVDVASSYCLDKDCIMNIIRMSGGLGNQMFQYALYLKLRSQGKEVKFDDINEYRGENVRPIMLSVFRIEYPRATWDEIVALTDSSTEILKRIKRRFTRRKAIEYYEKGHFDPQILTFDTIYLRGEFRSEKYFEDIAGEVRNTYQFQTLEDMHLPDKLYTPTKKYFDAIENCESVSIHMYRSDSRAEEELYEGICTEKYYEGAARYIQEKYPEATFFVFSNEPKWVKGWLNQLIASQIKEGMSKEEIKRMERRFILIESNTEYTGYLDMLLMSHCKHNIISNSSFSWWASWLNENANKTIIAPDRWDNENAEDDTIYMKGMTLINSRGRVERTVK